jgi:hypothetical protein
VRSIYDDDDRRLVAKRRANRRLGSTVASPVRAFYDPDRRRAMPRPSWGKKGYVDPATGGEPEIPLGLDFKYKDLLIAMLMEIVNVIRGHGHDVTAKEYERALNFVAARDRKLPENWLSFDDACWVCGIDPSAAARAIFEDQPGCSRLHLFSVYY